MATGTGHGGAPRTGDRGAGDSDAGAARALLQPAAATVTEHVHAVPGQRWSAPTPAEGWTVRDLVGHLVTEHLWVPHLLAGGTVADAGDRFAGDPLGEDPVAAWDRAARASLAAWGAVTSDERVVHLSAGPTPAGEYAEQMLLDLLVHGWDLARGAGLDDRLDPPTVAHVLAYVERRGEALTGSGLFGRPVDVDPGDPRARLLGLLGRRS